MISSAAFDRSDFNRAMPFRVTKGEKEILAILALLIVLGLIGLAVL